MFSQACKYAIRAVLYLAGHANEGEKVGVKDIAENLKVPRHFLAKLLQELSRNNIISSARGPNGGFYLNEENQNKTIMDVIRCIDGDEMFSSCVLGLQNCSNDNPCPLHIQAYAYREGLRLQLEHQQIREIAPRILAKQIRI